MMTTVGMIIIMTKMHLQACAFHCPKYHKKIIVCLTPQSVSVSQHVYVVDCCEADCSIFSVPLSLSLHVYVILST